MSTKTSRLRVYLHFDGERDKDLVKELRRRAESGGRTLYLNQCVLTALESVPDKPASLELNDVEKDAYTVVYNLSSYSPPLIVDFITRLNRSARAPLFRELVRQGHEAIKKGMAFDLRYMIMRDRQSVERLMATYRGESVDEENRETVEDAHESTVDRSVTTSREGAASKAFQGTSDGSAAVPSDEHQDERQSPVPSDLTESPADPYALEEPDLESGEETESWQGPTFDMNRLIRSV